LADPTHARNIGNTIGRDGAAISGGLGAGADGACGGSCRIGAVIGRTKDVGRARTAGGVIVRSEAMSGLRMWGTQSGDSVAIRGILIAEGFGHNGRGSHGVSTSAITEQPAIEEGGTLAQDTIPQRDAGRDILEAGNGGLIAGTQQGTVYASVGAAGLEGVGAGGARVEVAGCTVSEALVVVTCGPVSLSLLDGKLVLLADVPQVGGDGKNENGKDQERLHPSLPN
jgi:hypothetical protein